MKNSVSIIIPVYNCEEFIENCLDSIPEHDLIGEIIVCDDGSTDRTLEILQQYNKDITILTNESNRGVGYTFNKLIENVGDDYFCRIDADDSFDESFIDVLELIDGSDVIYFNMVDNDGTVRQLKPSTRMTTVACCHIYRTDFVNEIKTKDTNWGEDRYFHKQVVAKNPKELYTNINAYNYNYPRKDSLTDIQKRKKAGRYPISNPHLNIFTNCTNEILTRPTIYDTYESYVKTFGKPESFTIYCDPNPNPQSLQEYLKRLREYFNVEPVVTKGLADGWVKSIQNAPTSHIFQLEADWNFQNIDHSIEYIMQMMQKNGLFYMRFNQHMNQDYRWLRKWQTRLIGKKGYCLSDNLSNNPHILEVDYYKRHLLHLIDPEVPGAGLIEQNLEKIGHWGAVYGNYGHPPTILHTDGRGKGKK